MKSRKGRKPSPVQDTNTLDDDALANDRTAGNYLGISRTTLHRLTKAGKLKSVNHGGRNYRRMGDLRKLARERAGGAS